MADQKTTELTELTAAAASDILFIVDDPGGSPISKKITVENLLTSGASAIVLPDASGTIGTVTTPGAITINSLGYFGIGMAPTQVLSVAGNVVISPVGAGENLSIDRYSGNPRFFSPAPLIFQSNNGTYAFDFIHVSSSVVRILANGNFGIGTTAPGQIFDVNQGSGNMIADGYDTHSLSAYKKDIAEAIPDLEKFTKLKVFTWKRPPFVSAEELATAAKEVFDIEQWEAAFPNGYRGGKLRKCPDPEILEFLDNIGDQLRAERCNLPEWQREHCGLIADDESLLENYPDIATYDDEGNPKGVSINNQVGLLHGILKAAVIEILSLKEEISTLRDTKGLLG